MTPRANARLPAPPSSLPGHAVPKVRYISLLAELHAHALSTWDRVKDRPLLMEGNNKTGKRGKYGVMLVSKGLAFHDCPGKTEKCTQICYSMTFHYLMNHGKGNGIAAHTSWLAHHDPEQLAALYERDLQAHLLYAKTVVVRLNEAGDFVSAAHVEALADLARRHPAVTFYGYSRSWVIPDVARALVTFNQLPNVVIRESLDDDRPVGTGLAPLAFVGSQENAPPRSFKCPEQLGGPKCVSCGLCWTHPQVPVIFKKH